MYDIAIVGAGPAGLTAAIYAARANKSVVVFEALACGGQIINTSHIDNYPVAPHITGLDFGKTLQKQAEDLGVEIVYDEITHITPSDDTFTLASEDDEYKARSVIIATGTKPRKLNLANEDELVGRGVSYCATCDGGFYKGKAVAVNGGGNSALHEALYLSDICEKVYLVHRRDEFRADAALVDKVKAKDNIELVLNANITKLNGEKHLESIETDNGHTINVEGLFVSIGRIPNAAGLVDGLNLVDDYVDSGEDCKTNIPGIFVAGDVRTKELRQLVTATSDGAIAATAAINFLSK